MDRKAKLMVQVILCLGIFTMVKYGPSGEDGKLGNIMDKVGEAIRENYTLAELLEMSQDTAAAVVSVPAKVEEAVVAANEKVQYGKPMDEDGDEDIRQVYAVAGGKVLRSGIRQDIGMYVMVEHPDKISTYGQLCNVAVVTGDRVKKGDIVGSFDSTGENSFYYALEEKSGIIG